jgi:DNA-binding response OmpR family regulator
MPKEDDDMATILLVDDDEQIRAMFKTALIKKDHHVVDCSTLGEGQRLYSSVNPDILITDGKLLDGNAVPWAEELFAAGKTVLIISGSEQSEIVPVLKKPCSLAMLISKVNELLKAREV